MNSLLEIVGICSGILVPLVIFLLAQASYSVRKLMTRVEDLEKSQSKLPDVASVRQMIDDKTDSIKERLESVDTKLEQVLSVLLSLKFYGKKADN